MIMSTENGSVKRKRSFTLEDARLIQSVSDTIFSILTLLDDPSAVFCKTIDCLLISIGSPFVMKITDVDGMPGVFFTGPESTTEFSDQVVPFLDALDIGLVRSEMQGETEAQRLAAQIEGYWILDQITRAVAKIFGHQENLAEKDSVVRKLRRGFASMANQDRGKNRQREYGGEETDELESLLRVLDRRLAKDYSDLVKVRSPSGSQDISCPRLFFFRRHIDERERLQVQMHLLPSQKALFSYCWHSAMMPNLIATKPEYAAPINIHEAAKVVTRGLTDVPWEDLDSAFRTGATSWIRWPWDVPGYDGASHQATEILRDFLAIAGVEARPFGDDVQRHRSHGRAVLAVPLHVGGFPWLVMIVAFLRDEGIGKRRSISGSLYRDGLGSLSTRIGEFAVNAYDERIKEIVLNYSQSEVRSRAVLNTDLSATTAVFPFQICHVLQEDAPGEPSDDVFTATISGDAVSIRLDQNPLLAESVGVAHNTLSADHIHGLLTTAESARSERLQRRVANYEAIGHVLNNIARTSGWEDAGTKLFRAHKQVADQTIPEPLREALDETARCFAMLGLIRGLGETVRLAAAESGSFHWEKFQDWVDPDAVKLWSQGASSALCSAYASSIFEIVKSFCYGAGWQSCSVEAPQMTSCDHQLLHWSSGDALAPMPIESLYFPPFRRGSPAGYAVLYALAEPIINGIDALNAGASQFGLSKPLQMRVSVISDGGGRAIEVTVRNLSLSDINRPVSGLESIRNLLRGSGFISFRPHQANKLPEGNFEISLPVVFNPQRILRNIQRDADGALVP